MPIYDFICPECDYLIENVYATYQEFDDIKAAGGIPCQLCPAMMHTKPVMFNVQFAKVRNSKGKLQPGDKRGLRKMMEERYRKRNERLEAMPKPQQERFIKFMERMGVRKTAPSSPDTV